MELVFASVGSDLLHRPANRRNGLDSRSSASVVAGPWPGKTIVSSGSASNFKRIDRIISGYDPPHKSVRPIEPAKSVSPAKSHGACAFPCVSCASEEDFLASLGA